MRLNVEFKEGKRHAWLLTKDSAELFIHRPFEALQVTDGCLTCRVPADLADEIRDDAHLAELESRIEFEEPDGVFLVCAGKDETKLYHVQEAVTFAGGDVLLFIRPVATFH